MPFYDYAFSFPSFMTRPGEPYENPYYQANYVFLFFFAIFLFLYHPLFFFSIHNI